jgi:hypothetical protein
MVCAVRCLSDLGRFPHDFRVLLHTQEHGGYVGMAKRYRRHLREQGRLRTFGEKVERNPRHERVIGAPVFWLEATGHPRRISEALQLMAGDGLDRAIVNLHAWYYDQVGRPDWATALEQVTATARDLGYLVSWYDQYRDTHPLRPGRPVFEQWHTDLYTSSRIRDRDGRFVRGFGPDSGVIRADLATDLAARRVASAVERYGHTGYFIDCLGFVAPIEDVDWTPGRELGVRGVLDQRLRLVNSVLDHGVVVGTEAASDWTLPWVGWLEGTLTLTPFCGGHPPGWGYYPEPRYYHWQLDPRYRIPFHALVSGDCANHTWRWDDGMDRYPQYWRDRNLWTVLYGGSPIFSLSYDGYRANREAIRHTYRFVCDQVQRVAAAELVSHRFLEADGAVQESLWQTTVTEREGVIVNFGDAPYTPAAGVTVPAHGYTRVTETEDGVRRYTPSPVAARDCGNRRRPIEQATEDFEKGYSGILRLALSPDRAQARDLTTDPGQVISGRFSAVGENRNPDQRYNTVLTTNIQLAALAPGTSYRVTCAYRILDRSEGMRVYCSAFAGNDFLGDTSVPVTEVAAAGTLDLSLHTGTAEDALLMWGFEGRGAVVFDDINIRRQ